MSRITPLETVTFFIILDMLEAKIPTKRLPLEIFVRNLRGGGGGWNGGRWVGGRDPLRSRREVEHGGEMDGRA